MLAAPIVNPITILSTYTAFNSSLEMALSRALLGYSVAVFVGVLILFLPLEKILKQSLISRLNYSGKGKTSHSNATCDHGTEESRCSGHDHDASHHHDHQQCSHSHDEKQADCSDSHHSESSCSHVYDEKHENCSVHHHKESDCSHDHNHDHGECDHPGHEHHHDEDRLVSAMRVAMRDFIDVVVYFVIGVSLVTLLRDSIIQQDSWASKLAGAGDVQTSVFMMGLAFILSLCSTSDAFIVATSFGEKFGRVSKMAFMVYGPMMDVKLMFLYQTLMRWRAVVGLAILLFILVGTLCLFWGTVYFEWLSPMLDTKD